MNMGTRLIRCAPQTTVTNRCVSPLLGCNRTQIDMGHPLMRRSDQRALGEENARHQARNYCARYGEGSGETRFHNTQFAQRDYFIQAQFRRNILN